MSPLGIRYAHADAATLDWWDGLAFDGIVSNMALMDIDNLEGALDTVSDITTESGWFVFSSTHPCFPGHDTREPSWPREGSYFDETWWMTSNDGLRARVGATHRTLNRYLNAVTARASTFTESTSHASAAFRFRWHSWSQAGASRRRATVSNRWIAPRIADDRASPSARFSRRVGELRSAGSP